MMKLESWLLAGADLLLRSTLWLSLCLCLIMLLRPILRRSFGAEVSYVAWALVPLVLLAVCLPPLPITVLPPLQAWSPLAELVSAPTTVAAQTHLWQAWLAALWLPGFWLVVISQWRAQRRYLVRLQPLRRHHDHLRSDSPEAEPALLGGWSPQLVLPGDFEARYTAQQQELVRLHEAVHARRRDPLINLFTAILVALYWFHPLVHAAARLVRRDQELACDAAVLRVHPRARRPYAEALLNTQLDRPGLPVGCTWQSSHPLKQRLEMLKQPVPTSTRFSLGLAALALLAAPVVLSAWSAEVQPGQSRSAVDWSPRLANLAGHVPRYPTAALTAKQAGQVLLQVTVNRDGSVSDALVVRAKPAEVFDQAALEYARGMRFEPAPPESQASSATVKVPINFALTSEQDSPSSED